MSQQPLSSSAQPTDVYGGDEVSAMVLDPGYCHTRAGYAGEDVPKSILPSFYGRLGSSDPPKDLFGDEYLIPQADLEVKNYMSRESVVEDWDVATKMWEYMLVNRLQPGKQTPPSKNGLNDDPKETPAEGEANGNGAAAEDADVNMDDVELQEKALQENPLLMTEAPWNTAKSREKAIEIIMENWGCPAFWLSRTPVLAAFAAGKPSALVIDVGGSNTSVTAIHDGMALKRSIQKSPVAGLWLTSQVRSLLDSTDAKLDIVPTYQVESKTPVDAGAAAQFVSRTFPYSISDSFQAYEKERVVTEFKESVVEVWRGPGKFTNPQNEDYARNQPGRVYEFPNGANQMWREQRYRVSEGMWDETAALPVPGEEAAVTKAQTIPELIRSCLNAVDVDLRPNLLGNIVVTGSTSLLNGFNDRLNNELMTMFPGTKIKIHAAGLTTERRFGAWIGGSILASLGTFHQMWISRKEYEENGVNIVEKRCK
ncbi:actin family [Plectosphaerella cucumerina]|uniref:Actin-related protein 4 n=1 Tax=Plectosphaerella cucumerina TaxID=40658 RepID=A0A8K0TMK4_9PEZI|nr:actin family [Plectosphaerella cucumerina]